MSLYRRPDSRIWWASIKLPDGGRVRRSTDTEDRREAQEWLDRTKADLWRQRRLGEKPRRRWEEAVIRWFAEKGSKATLDEDRVKFRWLDQHLAGRFLCSITAAQVRDIGEAKRMETTPSTANRYLALVRSVLRAAAGPWEWIDKAPTIKLYREPKRRVRFLSHGEREALLAELPEHQRDAAVFGLETGLRQGNVLSLEWSQVDLARRAAWIHGDQAKGREAFGVPLNEIAVGVLRRQMGKHPTRVFTYAGKPIGQINTRAWRKALKRAGVEKFRWHDIRHTWASAHAMAGTTRGELQELGAWRSEAMVRRYAHFASGHLLTAADRLVTFWSRPSSEPTATTPQVPDSLAPRPGLEPGTCGLTVTRIAA